MIKINFDRYFSSVIAALLCLLLQADLTNADGLPTALTLTINKHPSVTAKLEELKSLGFDINAAEAGRYPSFSVQGQTMSNEQTQVIARLQQPLWAGGRIDGAINMAEIKLRSAQASLLQIRRQLMEDTAAIYAELFGARQRLSAAELNVVEHNKLLALISRRQVGSFASEADVRLARSRLVQAQTQQEQLRGVVDKALSDLQAQTQQPLAGLVPVTDEMLQLPDSAVIMKDAEINSPTIQLRMIDVDSALKQIDLRKADMMPTLHAVLERDLYLANKYGTLPSDTRIGLAVSGTVEGIGFAGFGRVKSATSLVEAARKEVESAKNDLRRRTTGFVTDRKMYVKVMESNNSTFAVA